MRSTASSIIVNGVGLLVSRVTGLTIRSPSTDGTLCSGDELKNRKRFLSVLAEMTDVKTKRCAC